MSADFVAGDTHPALRDLREVMLLSGFSGATVALVRDFEQPFVRKVSNRRDGNAALREQASRQQALSHLITGCANTPDILQTGERDGYFFFDMKFIPSRDAVNLLSNGSFDSVTEFAERIERLMERLRVSPPIGDTPCPPTKARLDDKLAQIAGRAGPEHAETLALLVAAAAKLETLNGSGVPTAAHGDLTFENILVDRRGELWLIDTIPSPFDHYWIDWSKLFQECEGLWHAHRGRQLARGVTWWLRQRFLKAATQLDPAYPMRHYVLLGLTFARILPYAKTEHDQAFVARRVIECGRAALEMFGER